MLWRDKFFNLATLTLTAWFSLGVLIPGGTTPGCVQKRPGQSLGQSHVLIPKSEKCCTLSCSNAPLNIMHFMYLSDFKQAGAHHGD